MNTNPTDIDATCNVLPHELFSSLEKHADEAMGLFKTEKFWTATILYAWHEWVKYTYEITPFREEWWYTDRRHPTEIHRSTSLLADASRRDFTVNALYYTTIGDIGYIDSVIWNELQIDAHEIATSLQKHWQIYISSMKLLILQDNEIIEKIILPTTIDTQALEAYCNEKNIDITLSDWLRLILDPTWWMQDIALQKIRTVGNPDQRFNEDALRILRALRFVNVWNQYNCTFDFTKETWNSIKTHYHLVQYLAKERIHDELVKVFSANNPFGYVALLDDANIMQYIFPALVRCKGNEQPVRYHPFDTYAHTILTLRHLQRINTNYLVKLGMLYHDVGKPEQYQYYSQCTTKEELEAIHGSWYNHTVCGPEFTTKDFLALGFSTKEVEEISWYVAMHMRPWQILEARSENQRKKVRLMYSEYWYDKVKNLFDICKSDRLWQYNPIQSSEIDTVDALYEHLEYLQKNEWQFTQRDMIVNGDIIMEHFSLEPWKKIGELLRKAFQRVVHEKDNRNTKHAILSYLKWVLANGE